MSTQTEAMSKKGIDPAGEAAAAAVPEGLAEQLVAQAKASGVALTGPGGLLSGLTKQVLETPGQGAKSNVRNGYSAKTVRTEIGDVRISVPRDRAGSFEPVMVPKHARHLSGFDQAVISLYAKGMTTGDIVHHLQDVYGTSVSKDLVSRVTDAVLEQMQAWASRPLDAVYPVLLIDCIYVKIREGQVSNRPIYVAMGITVEGERDVLGRPGRWRRGRTAVAGHAHGAEEPGRSGRPDRLLRRPQGPPRGHHRDLAPGDRAVVRGAPGPQQPAVRVQAALGQDHRRSEEGLHRCDPTGGRDRVRGVRPDLAGQVSGDGRDVGTVVAGVRPVPRIPA